MFSTYYMGVTLFLRKIEGLTLYLGFILANCSTFSLAIMTNNSEPPQKECKLEKINPHGTSSGKAMKYQ